MFARRRSMMLVWYILQINNDAKQRLYYCYKKLVSQKIIDCKA